MLTCNVLSIVYNTHLSKHTGGNGMRKLGQNLRVGTIVVAISMIASVAFSNAGSASSSKSDTSHSTAHVSGTVIVGEEQWPTCVNPLTQCAASTTNWWAVFEEVLPTALTVNAQGDYVASPLITEIPTAANGGVKTNPLRITYHLNPSANWTDGTPITSADFAFTWRAILNTPNAYTTSGYTDIASIDTSQPKTVVITFKNTYSSWQSLFGGVYQGIIEAHAFPTLENSAKPDLSNMMANSIPFSGGPWILQSFSQTQEVLVPNTNYWGKIPNLSELVVVPESDQSTEVASLLAGQVDAIQPQTPSSSLVAEMKSAPNVKQIGGGGLFDEAVWFNDNKAPLNNVRVRQALLYAINGKAVINTVIKPIASGATVLNCGLISYPTVGQFCKDKVFAKYTYNPKKSLALLKAAGYKCTNVPRQPCAKNGKPLNLIYSTTVPNTVRTSGQQIIVQDAHAAGFNIEIKNFPASILFSDIAPKGNFNLIEYANGGTPAPSDTPYFGCANIPTKKNKYSGGNWPQWCSPQANRLMLQSDATLNPAQQAADLTKVYQLEAAQAVSDPLYLLPSNGAWRTDKVTGPVSQYVESFLGMLYNANYWSAAP